MTQDCRFSVEPNAHREASTVHAFDRVSAQHSNKHYQNGKLITANYNSLMTLQHRVLIILALQQKQCFKNEPRFVYMHVGSSSTSTPSLNASCAELSCQVETEVFDVILAKMVG